MGRLNKKQKKEAIRLTHKFGRRNAADIQERKKDQRDVVTRILDRTGYDPNAREKPVGKRKEDPKKVLVCRGAKTSEVVDEILKDLWRGRAPLGVGQLSKKKDEFHPFEDVPRLERTLSNTKCQMMVLGSSSKKRPCRLVMARTYNGDFLDMVEFQVIGGSLRKQSKTLKKGDDGNSVRDELMKSAFGNPTKAFVITQGALWQDRYEMITARSILTDFFYSHATDKIVPLGVERVVSLTAVPQKSDYTSCPTILVQEYRVQYKKSSDKVVPYVELIPTNFMLQLSVDRCRAADERVMNKALRVPREQFTTKSRATEMKGVKRNAYGDVVAKMHFKNDKDDLKKLFTPDTRLRRRKIPEGTVRRADKAEEH